MIQGPVATKTRTRTRNRQSLLLKQNLNNFLIWTNFENRPNKLRECAAKWLSENWMAYDSLEVLGDFWLTLSKF